MEVLLCIPRGPCPFGGRVLAPSGRRYTWDPGEGQIFGTSRIPENTPPGHTQVPRTFGPGCTRFLAFLRTGVFRSSEWIPSTPSISQSVLLGFDVFRFGLSYVLGASGRPPEAPGRPTDGSGGPSGDPRTPPGPGQKTRKPILVAGSYRAAEYPVPCYTETSLKLERCFSVAARGNKTTIPEARRRRSATI